MSFVFTPPALVSVPVLGKAERFPIHRIYCVGRNYEEHAKEMGFTGREPPFFFFKPNDSLVVVNSGETGSMPYPSLTKTCTTRLNWWWPLAWAAKTSKRLMPKNTFMATPLAWT